MAIVKIIKRDNPYIQIDKTGIEDPYLSWGASGLLTFLIGRPSDWKVNLNHLSGVKFGDKKDKTRGYLNELREWGYCHYFEIRESGKVVETLYLVFEVPTNYQEVMDNSIEVPEGCKILYKPIKTSKTQENKEVSPKLENPISVKPISENPTLHIKEYTNKRNTNKKHIHVEESIKEVVSDVDGVDVFEKLFDEFKINYTNKNRKSVENLRKKLGDMETEKYLREVYIALKENPNINNLPGLFTNLLEKGKRVEGNKKTENEKKSKTLDKPKQKEMEIEEINEKDNFKTSEMREKYSSLSQEEKDKLEKTAINIVAAEMKLSKEFFEIYKKNSPEIYKGIVMPYIFKMIKENIKTTSITS